MYVSARNGIIFAVYFLIIYLQFMVSVTCRIFFVLVLVSAWSFVCYAQSTGMNTVVHHSPEEIASYQTRILMTELGLTDSAQMDTLYRIHLKYAHLRMQPSTQATHLANVTAFHQAIQQVLTPKQYELFMKQHTNRGPRHSHHPIGKVQPSNETERTQSQTSFRLPADRPVYHQDSVRQDTSGSSN